MGDNNSEGTKGLSKNGVQFNLLSQSNQPLYYDENRSVYYDILLDAKCSGMVRDDLKEVTERFRKLLVKEREGLSLAVYKNDMLIVDLWGGYADREHNKLWREDTLTVGFSTSKVIGALIVAILVSRGHLKYEDLVYFYKLIENCFKSV